MNMEHIQAGDEVIFHPRAPSIIRLVTVDRVTKTLIVIGALRFRKLDGNIYGGDNWSHTYISLATPDLRERARFQLKKKKAINALGTLSSEKEKWSESTIDQILAVYRDHKERD